MTDLTSPVGEVQDNAKTASYSERSKVKKAASDGLKGKGKPLGGAPEVEAGKLDSLVRPSFAQPEPEVDEGGFRPPKEPPEETMPGVGSAYPANQAMARGETDGPVSLKEANEIAAQQTEKPPLSPESIEALSKVKESMEEAPIDPLKDELDKADKQLSSAPEFDLEGIIRQKHMLATEDRKLAIEKRLIPLDISDMITKREIQQRIPVIPGKLEIVLRTFNQHENLFCLRHVYNMPGSAMYIEELLNTCKLVCSLVSVNDALLPEHRTGVGTVNEEVDEEAFRKKMFHVAAFPVQFITDLSVQAIWFADRVNDLFDLDNLKNG